MPDNPNSLLNRFQRWKTEHLSHQQFLMFLSAIIGFAAGLGAVAIKNLTHFIQHLMEDRSGAKLGNAPDGRYGIFVRSVDRNKFFNSIMYEFYTTHDQSLGVDGVADNYFNDGIYTSGWTYENRVLGAPFFTVDPEGEGIINNRFSVHHLGIGGQPHNYFNTYPVRFLFSYARNEGTYAKEFEEVQHVYSLFYEQRVYEGFLDVSFQAGAEFHPEEGIFGLGVKVRREL